MTAPNEKLWQAGAQLQGYLGQQFTAALEHVYRELSILDGYSSGQAEVVVRATAELTPVERAAEERWRMTNAREELRDAQARVLAEIKALNDMVNAVLRMRAPRLVVKPEDKLKDCCANGQKGLDGVFEWGDPLCLMSGVKRGMCQKHYQRYRRYMLSKDVNIDAKDFGPAA